VRIAQEKVCCFGQATSLPHMAAAAQDTQTLSNINVIADAYVTISDL